jgi:S1-C subfamily serine protease
VAQVRSQLEAALPKAAPGAKIEQVAPFAIDGRYGARARLRWTTGKHELVAYQFHVPAEPQSFVVTYTVRAADAARLAASIEASARTIHVAPVVPAPGLEPDASGTGFVITKDGHLATNCHVVHGGTRFVVHAGEAQYTATVRATDADSDLAILEIEGPKPEGQFEPLAIAPSDEVRLGTTVGTVGFPNPELQGTSPKFTKGEISSLRGVQDSPLKFQISVPLQPGNSGGALIDGKGNVVGIVSSSLSQVAAIQVTGQLAENVSYAIKSQYLLALIDTIPGLAAALPPRANAASLEDAVEMAVRASVRIDVYR